MLSEGHLTALDRRLVVVMRTVANCLAEIRWPEYVIRVQDDIDDINADDDLEATSAEVEPESTLKLKMKTPPAVKNL